MRERDDRQHEARGAYQLDVPHIPEVEALAELMAARNDDKSLADLRQEWQRFDERFPRSAASEHPVLDDYVAATNLAYARMVSSKLEQETGTGLRDRHPAADIPPLATERPPGMRVEDWYASRITQLPPTARAAVDREVERTRHFPMFSYLESTRRTLRVDAERLDDIHARGCEDSALRTRVYAAAVIYAAQREAVPQPERQAYAWRQIQAVERALRISFAVQQLRTDETLKTDQGVRTALENADWKSVEAIEALQALRYDIAVRALAAESPEAAEQVRRQRGESDEIAFVHVALAAEDRVRQLEGHPDLEPMYIARYQREHQELWDPLDGEDHAARIAHHHEHQVQSLAMKIIENAQMMAQRAWQAASVDVEAW